MDEKQILFHLDLMRRWDKEGIAPAENTQEYVDEILELWAPLAERRGMHTEQVELQNLAVKMGYPEDYQMLKKMLANAEMSCEVMFRSFVQPIKALLDEMGIEFTIKYRMKSIYSSWLKMRVDNKCFDDLYDLFAARIVYKPMKPCDLPGAEKNCLDADPEVAAVKQQTMDEMNAERFTCWRIYTVISMLYRIHPDRIKNWIGNPKPSGYEALHLTVMGPDRNWFEIQIRSERMDYDAEHGIAAHWKYKAETRRK